MDNAYFEGKLQAHPEILAAMRSGKIGRLITVHLMPQNVCNQSCSFCSYRLPLNKNSEVFNESAHIPIERMRELLLDFNDMGVQGIEVTGGGEPLAYPHTDELWGLLADYGFATGLVTNGTLMNDRAPLICRSRLKWARVSIDCSKKSTYQKMRRAPGAHYERAWRALLELREHADDPEFQLGAGFVLCNENMDEVYDFVRMAKEHGADNVRLSVTYSSDNERYFDSPDRVPSALLEAKRAKDELEDESFTVHNLMSDRWNEVLNPVQDYHRCPTQEVLCVVEGEGRVYTCCTFTGSSKGDQGVFWEHPEGFRGLWRDKAHWRAKLDPRSYCRNSCLYEKRNRQMIALIEDGAPKVLHSEFI